MSILRYNLIVCCITSALFWSGVRHEIAYGQNEGSRVGFITANASGEKNVESDKAVFVEVEKPTTRKTVSPQGTGTEEDIPIDALLDDPVRAENSIVSTKEKVPELPVTKSTGKNADGTYTLVSGRKIGTVDRVEIVLEAVGDVMQFLEGQESKSNKMEVLAGFRYEERTLEFSNKSDAHLKSFRYYDAARAKIKIGDHINMPELDSEKKLIVCDVTKGVTNLFSPSGPLKDDQLLLIEDLPGNTLLLDQLLPVKSVRIGDTWGVPDKALCSLLGLEVIEKHDVKAKLTSEADNVALIEIEGEVEGANLGAASEMTVRVKFQFDLVTQRIIWLGILIEENRSIGSVGPAINLIAKVLVRVQPTEENEIQLTDERTKKIDTDLTNDLLKVCYDTKNRGPWRFLHDRKWYVFFDEPGGTKLRLLKNGELVSQCDIAQMGRASSDTPPSLVTFQDDLKKGLGASYGEVLSAKEAKSKKNYRELRVVIKGAGSDLELSWIYYLLIKSDGTQTVIAFVVPSDQLESFEGMDREIIDSFEML